MNEKGELVITASAPAKVILFGEHSVVYGAPAIAASINRRTSVSISRNKEDNLRLIFNQLGVNVTLSLQKPTVPSNLEIQKQRAIECCLIILNQLEPLKEGITLTVSSDFRLGAGLGSSASLSVSLAAALLSNEAVENGKDLPKDSTGKFTKEFLAKIKSLADDCERIFHGKPSGIDTSTCLLGGIVKFSKEAGAIKIADNLAIKIAVVDSKVERQTSKIVEKVQELMARLPKASSSLFDGMKVVAETAAEDISNGSNANILDLVRMNHGLLYGLGVSHPELERIGQSVSNLNVGFKLTGAGAGGNALIFIPPNVSEKEVVDQLSQNDFEANVVEVGVNGVHIDICRQ